MQEPALNAPIEITPNTAQKPWQDDGRFAIALVLLLVAINLLASAWLSPAQPQAKPVVSPQLKAPAVNILNELTPPESNQ